MQAYWDRVWARHETDAVCCVNLLRCLGGPGPPQSPGLGSPRDGGRARTPPPSMSRSSPAAPPPPELQSSFDLMDLDALRGPAPSATPDPPPAAEAGPADAEWDPFADPAPSQPSQPPSLSGSASPSDPLPSTDGAADAPQPPVPPSPPQPSDDPQPSDTPQPSVGLGPADPTPSAPPAPPPPADPTEDSRAAAQKQAHAQAARLPPPLVLPAAGAAEPVRAVSPAPDGPDSEKDPEPRTEAAPGAAVPDPAEDLDAPSNLTGEARLGRAYEDSLAGLATGRTQIVHFDWHGVVRKRGAKDAIESLWRVVADRLVEFGVSHGEVAFTAEGAALERAQCQRGVFRFNCRDSLDRTNLCIFICMLQVQNGGRSGLQSWGGGSMEPRPQAVAQWHTHGGDGGGGLFVLLKWGSKSGPLQ